MRGVPAIAALLIAALVVALLVRQQLRPAAVRAPAGPVPGVAAPPADPLRAEQQVRDGLAAAEAEAKKRNDAAERQAD